jgi:NAD(P)-dependent dehydrogenase (short-subunit alcohol dehydrogenase family)
MSEDSKSVLITGASGGVGRATVARLSELGWQVFAGVRSLPAGADLAREHPGVVPVELDVCDEESLRSARDEVARHLPGRGLDALVNNAGLSVDGPIELVPVAALRRQLDVNVIGKVATTQVFLPMLRLARGRVVNIGGAIGRMPLPMYGALGAATAALDSVTETLRMELRYQGVDVSYVESGALETDFFRKSAGAARRDGYAGTPEVQQIYAAAIEASSKAMAGAGKSPVEVVVAAVVKALRAGRPATRYTIGAQAKVGRPLLLRLPDRLRDRTLLSTLGLGSGTFDGVSSNGSSNGGEAA